MPGKLLAGMCGLLLPRFTACGQNSIIFLLTPLLSGFAKGGGQPKEGTTLWLPYWAVNIFGVHKRQCMHVGLLQLSAAS